MAATKVESDQLGVKMDARRHGRRLLVWYDENRRDLPWRAAPGEAADPYRVWLSEIMLQQTTVTAVIPYFERFTARWPDAAALAAADLDDVLVAWQGLGYYARARNLVKCAATLAADHGGVFPDTEQGLLALPGIGPYTAAAIAAIAFGRPAVVVDGNVERVVARLFAVTDPLPGAKPELRRRAAELTPRRRAGDYAQAMMDLGATICTPRSPYCAACPLAACCAARAAGLAEELPARPRRRAKPLRRGTAWFVVNGAGEILLRRRAERGLLGGMMEVPSSPWEAQADSAVSAPVLPDIDARWRLLNVPVEHVFTHFRLELTVAWARIAADEAEAVAGDGIWAAPDALAGHALPTVMKKVCAAGLAAVENARA